MKKYIFLCIITFLLFACDNNEDVFPWGKNPIGEGTYPTAVEIPQRIDNNDYIYVTHQALLNGRTVRNYMMCFDKTKYAANWVAYPLHSCYMGSSGRTDAWALDSDISSTYQVPTKGYSTWNYTRGHQIPSADRTANNDLNAQTFYMSNMTPQGYYFNSGTWLKLETRIRSYVCSDTLYVVTGAYWGVGSTTVNRYPVPTHYYKVVLRTRAGNTQKTVFDTSSDNLKCIGFWLEHKVFADQEEANVGMETLSSSHCKSVADIERLTGFTFFPEVDVDKTRCVPSDWGF